MLCYKGRKVRVNQIQKGLKGTLTAASIFAGLSSLGLDSIEMTLIKMVSTVCTGDQRSLACSYPYLSSPGGCYMQRTIKEAVSISDLGLR